MATEKINSFTEGPIFSRLVCFILPIMVVNLLQVFYNSADMIIVGMSSEADAVGAVGTTLPMINLIVNSFIGISVGANVTFARSIGERNADQARKILHTSLLFSVIIGIFASAIGLAVSRWALESMGNRGRLLELSTVYSRIYFLGVPFLSLTNFAAALLRASGDSKSPLYVLTLTGLFNVLANLFFVKICSLSVEGVAISTLLANAISAILLTVRLGFIDKAYRFRFSALKIDKKALLSILKIGLPAGAQSAVFSLSHLLIQSSILTVNNLAVGADAQFQPVVKGTSAAANLELFSGTAVVAVGQATITFISQNAGAGKWQRIRRIRWFSYLIASIVAVVLSCTILLLRAPLLELYGVYNDDSDELMRLAYESAEVRTYVMMIPYSLLACFEMGSAILQGLSKTLSSTIISISGSVIFRIIWLSTVFVAKKTLVVIFISFPITWLITSVIQFIFASKELSKQEKKATQSI